MQVAERLHTITMAVVVLVLSAVATQASVVYNFVGTGLPSEPMAFQLTVSDFVNPPLGNPGPFVDFTCAQLDSSTNCDSQLPGISFSNQGVAFSAQLTFDAINNTEYAFFFPTGAFDAPGVYSAESGRNFNSGTLTVTQTPEPHTIIMLALSGFCLCGFRRFPTKRSTAA
jgi:hypothetical protein